MKNKREKRKDFGQKPKSSGRAKNGKYRHEHSSIDRVLLHPCSAEGVGSIVSDHIDLTPTWNG